MFRFFETRIDFRKQPPEEPPPDTLWGFYWHFIAQAKGLFIALFALGFVLAIFEALIPYLIGRLVNALSHTSPEGIFSEAGPLLITMAAVILLVRPFGTILFRLLVNHSLAVSFTTMVHWQNYWHVVRQPLAFFQDDFAGRIANRVLQTGRPLRESILSVARAVWQILIFGAASIGLLGTQDIRLALPMAGWFTLYAALLGRCPAADPEAVARVERGAFRRDRQGGGQLHQHHDGEAVRAPEGGGRLHQRGL